MASENTYAKATDHLNSTLGIMESSILFFEKNVYTVLLILISLYLKKKYNEIKQEAHI